MILGNVLASSAEIHRNLIKCGPLSGGESEHRQSMSGNVQTESTGVTKRFMVKIGHH